MQALRDRSSYISLLRLAPHPRYGLRLAEPFRGV